MQELKLDKFERQILDDFNKGLLTPTKNKEQSIQNMQEAAKLPTHQFSGGLIFSNFLDSLLCL